MIVVMAGLPGTGKSTLAAAVAARRGGIVVSKDRIRDAAFGDFVDYSLEQDDFCMELVYRVVTHLRQTRPAMPVIVDGRTYTRRAHVTRMLKALPETPRVIECYCDEHVARARIEAEGAHVARNRTWEMYQALKFTAEPLAVPRIRIDTGRMSVEEALGAAGY